MTLSFQQAFENFLDRAPGPVFPRARQLYRLKYCLEGGEPEPFRTFLIEEEIQESGGGALRIRAVAFAVVHWHAGQTGVDRYASYLQERWQLRPGDLTQETEDWFRQGGAWARFTTPAVYERNAPTALVSSAGLPGVPREDPG